MTQFVGNFCPPKKFGLAPLCQYGNENGSAKMKLHYLMYRLFTLRRLATDS